MKQLNTFVLTGTKQKYSTQCEHSAGCLKRVIKKGRFPL